MAILKKVKEFFAKPKEAEKEEEQLKEKSLSMQFDLGVEEEKKICELIELEVKDREASRADFMAKRVEGIKLYEGIREPKSYPWVGSSNLSTMVTTVSCDLLQAKLFPMVWTPDTLYWEGVEKHDVDVANDIKTLMNFVVGPSEMVLEPTIDDILHRLIVDGTIIAKKRWGTYWTYITRKVPKSTLTYEQVMSGKVEYDVKYDYIKRERCYVDLKNLESVYLKYDATNEDDAEPIEEIWYTLAELRELQADGIIKEDIDIDDLAKAMDELPEFKGTEEQRMRAEGTVPVNTRKENYKIKCYEAYIKYDVNDDKKRENCVFLVVAKPKMYLSGKPLHTVSRIGKTPWKIRPFLRRPGRIYGKSIPELVMHLHKEMDAIHNQRIDAGNMAIAPFFFYRQNSGLPPGNITVGPATGVPVEDPDRDVRFPQFPTWGIQISFQEERLVMDMIERLTYLTPAMLGREVASRPTARGTLAVMAQGEQKFSLLARRVQYIIGSLITDIKQTYEENMPPELQSRILGKEGNPIFTNLSPETIAGQYDAKMILDLSAGNIAMEREINSLVRQSMLTDPLVMQNPAHLWEIDNDYLTSLNKDVEKYIGPKPQITLTDEDADDVYQMIRGGKKPTVKSVDAGFLNRLLEIKNSPLFAQLDPNSKALFIQYIMEAKGFYVETMQKRMMEYAQSQGQGGAGGPEELALTPGMGGNAGVGSPGPTGPTGPGGIQVGNQPPPSGPGA